MQQLSLIETKTETRILPLRDADLPPRQRPINRVCESGPASVSDAEALAALIQGPSSLQTAYRLLTRFSNLRGLARATIAELQQVEGIGKAQAARIKAALDLGRRLLFEQDADEHRILTSPADIANVLPACRQTGSTSITWPPSTRRSSGS